ncbi:MAG TPA: S8 family serine peptidase [Candidatus Koribacter sp.]|jgi:hypothetical protein
MRGRAKWALIIIPIIIAAYALTLTGATESTNAPAERKLFKNHRLLMAIAAARGDKDLVVLIASRPGENAHVAEEVARLGGEVHFREDAVDYLRARVPLASMEKLAAYKGVQNLDIDINIDKWDPAWDDFFPPEKEEPSSNPPDPDTPLSHPYLPTSDMDITRLHEENSSFDGRGTGVAILDATPDFLMPEMQTATTLDGRSIRKIAQALAVSDPRDDDDPMWVKMDATVTANGGKFSYKDQTYTAPADGTYRLGFFDERALHQPAYLYKDVNFDGNPPGSSGLFAVLWDEQKNVVWVDTNQDHSFVDERPLMDYGKRMDLGIFGSNQPASRRRKTVAFAVQTDAEKKYVRITLGVWQHVSEVSGAAVGKGFYGGAYDGVAPGARLISVFDGSNTVFRGVEGAIRAAKLEDVDVICLEPSILEETINPLHDGRAVAGVIFDRVIDKYNKLILSPANNSPGMNTVVDEVSSNKIVAVGAYQAGESYRINNGAEVRNHDNLHLVGSYGPAGDGGLKPEILSASELISTDAGYKPPEKRKGVYELPPGYSIAGGTSTAGPTATASAALLISAAKQSNVPYDAARIRAALLSSARYIPEIPAYKQGNGLVQVDAAWKMLQAMNGKFDPVVIESHAPVKTVYSDELATPNEGRGIYEREGWSVGQTASRTITFVRKSGSADPITYRTEWVGNDGSFKCADSISLPLNTPVKLPVSITANGPGVHSAILNLKHGDEPWIAYQTMSTIVVPDDFTPANHYQVVHNEGVDRPGSSSYFLRVPPETTALEINLDIPSTSKGTLRASVIAPDQGHSVPFDMLGVTKGGHLNSILRNPVAGVWEIVLYGNNFAFFPEEIDSKPLGAVPAKFTASLVSVAASQSFCQIGRGGAQGCPTEISFTNRLGQFHGGAVTAALGSSREQIVTVSAGERKIFEINVPPGTEELSAAISHPSDPSADVDLYLLDDTHGLAVLKNASTGRGAVKTVAAMSPAAGRWKIVVDGYKVTTGSVRFSYVDVINHPAYGTITVDDKAADHGSGSQWRVRPTVEVGAVPAGGRSLVGFVPVRVSDDQSETKTLSAFEKNLHDTQAGVPVGTAKVGFK